MMTMLMLLAVVAFVFSFGITEGYIGLDDWGYTSGCPFVRGGICWRNIARAFSDFGYCAIWMPVTFISYMLDVSVFGDSWKAYHAVNVALHMLNTLLVYRLLMSITSRLEVESCGRSQLVCAIAAIVWAVHPLRAEGVTFVASRKEVLWTLFSLSGMLIFNGFTFRRSAPKYALVVICFLLALMSKPTAMCLPFVMMSVAYLEKRLDKGVVVAMLPLVVLSACSGFLTVYSQSHPSNSAVVDVYGTPFLWRVLNAVVSVGLYAWYTVWPIGIHMDYRAVFNGWPVDGWLGLSVAFLIFVVMVIAVIRLSHNGRRILFGVTLFFFFSLGPTLGVFGYVNGDQAMADRYTYFPHIALSILLACGLISCPGNILFRKILVAVLTFFVMFEVLLAIPVVKSYENGYTAWSRALAKDPDNWRALRIVGSEYCAKMNRVDEGIAMLRKSLRLRKSRQTADSLAYMLAMRGAANDFQEVKRLGAGVARNPQCDEGGMMLDALGIVYMREANYNRAAYYFGESLKAVKRNHSPDWSMLYFGLSLANIGRTDDAARMLVRLQGSKFVQVSRRARYALREISSGTVSEFKWE